MPLRAANKKIIIPQQLTVIWNIDNCFILNPYLKVEHCLPPIPNITYHDYTFHTQTHTEATHIYLLSTQPHRYTWINKKIDKIPYFVTQEKSKMILTHWQRDWEKFQKPCSGCFAYLVSSTNQQLNCVPPKVTIFNKHFQIFSSCWFCF